MHISLSTTPLATSPTRPGPGLSGSPSPGSPGSPSRGSPGSPSPGSPGSPSPGSPESPSPGSPGSPSPGSLGSPGSPHACHCSSGVAIQQSTPPKGPLNQQTELSTGNDI